MSSGTGLVRGLRDAHATLAHRIATLAALAERNLVLRLRLSSLSLLERVLGEVAEHRQAHGAAPGPLEALLELLRSGMGGGDGNGDGGQPQQQPLASAPARPEEAAPGDSAFVSAPCANDRGGTSIRGVDSTGGGPGGDSSTDAAAAAAADGGAFAQLPHLAPARRVLPLHEASEAEVAEARSADAAAMRRQLRGHYDDAVRLVRELDAARAARDAAAVDRLRAELQERSVRFVRFSLLMLCWAFDVYLEVGVKHYETHELMQGMTDARLPHWQHVVGAVQLTRPQALLISDVHDCVQARLQTVRAQRASLSSALAAATAAAAVAPDTTGAPAGPGARGASAAAEADLLHDMEANVAAEAALIQAASLTMIAVLTPGQFFRSFTASWPYPVSPPAICEVLASMLRLGGQFRDELPRD